MKHLKELTVKEQIFTNGGNGIDDFIDWADAHIQGISHAINKTVDEIYESITGWF